MTQKHNKKLKMSAFFAIFAIFSACVTPLPKYVEAVDYSTKSVILLDVADVIVVADRATDGATFQMGQAYGKTPEAMLRDWLNNRVQATGSIGQLSVVIHNANVAATPLEVGGGINGYFRRDQAEEWKGTLSATLVVEGSNARNPKSEISITVSATQTLPEKASAAEKRLAYETMTNKLIASFDAKAQEQIDLYFGEYRK